MVRKSFEQTISDIDLQIQALKEKRKIIAKSLSKKERNKRTHRLATLGATVEKVIGMEIGEDLLPSFKELLARHAFIYFETLTVVKKNLEVQD